MKKIISLSVLMLFGFSLMAQNGIANSGFENWNNGQPVSWTTAMSGNVLISVGSMQIPMPVSANFGTQSSDVHSGSSALKLSAQSLGVTGTEYSYTFPGMAQLGTAGEFNIPLETLIAIFSNPDSLDLTDLTSLASLSALIASGDSCSSSPVSLDMWVKYLPAAGDSMHVIAYTKANGIPVSFASYSCGETMSDYTFIRIPFYPNNLNCDSIGVVIFSGGFATDLTTELYVDDVTLNYTPLTVDEKVNASLQVYPNPANGYVILNPNNAQSYNYQLMDLAGKVVRTGTDLQGAQTVSVNALASGIYMLRFSQNNQTVTRKVIVR